MRITKAQTSLLAMVVASMANDTAPFTFVDPTDKDAAALIKGKLIETNAEITDGSKLAARATAEGIAANSAGTTVSTSTSTPAVPVVRAGSEGALTLDLDAFVKRPRSSANYDFDGMNRGDYFFIPATEARPNPAKSIASTVSAANKKFNLDTLAETDRRTYVVAPFDAGETKGGYKADTAGALVVRTK